LLIGSYSPIELNPQTITNRFVQAEVSTSLKAVGVASPAALLATWVTGREGLERYAANVRPVTDDYPRIEYVPWVHPKEITVAPPELLALRTDPPLVNGDDALRGEIALQRQSLLDFYSAGIAGYNGDREAWAAAMRRVTAADSVNPYHEWISGDR
jgi:hypothetical protein